MSAIKYKKKPVEIEAFQWDGSLDCASEIINWGADNKATVRYIGERPERKAPNGEYSQFFQPCRLKIETLEGWIFASPGDFIIKGIQGEFYPCKPDIFAETYEVVV